MTVAAKAKLVAEQIKPKIGARVLNTGTLHRAEAYDPATGRLMLRTKLEVEEPFN